MADRPPPATTVEMSAPSRHANSSKILHCLMLLPPPGKPLTGTSAAPRFRHKLAFATPSYRPIGFNLYRVDTFFGYNRSIVNNPM